MKDDPETYAIIGAAMEVHRVLGCGFLEAVCQEALEIDTLVELKALDKMSGVEQSKLLNYLKASESPKGLLINFGAQSLEYQRFVN